MRPPPVIGIIGRAGAGKDTIADYLCRDGTGYIKDSIAAPMKEGLAIMLGEDLSAMNDRVYRERPYKNYGVSIRQMLQTLGTEWGRNMVSEDLWISMAIQRVIERGKIGLSTVFADIRFANEAHQVKMIGGTLIGVTRPDNDLSFAHASEQLDPFYADHHLMNDGTIQQLYDQLDEIFHVGS